MERKRMMETTKEQSYWWWFDSHKNSPGRSQWLQSTISALDEKTKAMLMIIEEDADSFAQRAEMYYKKRPQLVGMVEDFYRAHRSLAEQFDHLRHDPSTRRTSPLARSFCLSKCQPEKVIDPHKSYDACFAKLSFNSEDLCLSPLSKTSSEKSLHLLNKPFGGRYTDLAYDYDESVDSEVDDPVSEVDHHEAVDMGEELSYAEENHEDLMAEIVRLEEQNMIQKKQLMEKDKTIEELKLKLSESATEVMELKEESERLRAENVEMCLLKAKDTEERDELIAENATLNKLLLQKSEEMREAMEQIGEVGALQMEIQEQKEKLEQKDEEKRDVIRQLSVAIEMLKGENRLLKKALASESNKRWNPFDSQVLKGFGKLFYCSIMSSQPSVVPL